MGNPAGKHRGSASGGQPRNLAEIEAKQLRQAEVVRKRLDRELADKGPEWMPTSEWLDAYHKNADIITRLARGIRLGREADHRYQSKLTDEQLDQVFLRELPRMAMQFTTAHWEMLDRIRGQQAALYASREATEFADGNKAAVRERAATEHEVLL